MTVNVESVDLDKNKHADRVENFKVVLNSKTEWLSKEQLDSIKKYLKVKLGKGDTVKITYDFEIFYWNTVKALALILNLIDSSTIDKATTKELAFGKSLIQEVLCKIEQLENKFKEKGK